MSGLRILALDIDGTLIGSDKRIPRFTAEEIRRVVETDGIHLILVTARGPQSTALIEEQLGVPASYATFGGALVWAREADGGFTTLSETPLDPAATARFVELAAATDVHIGVYTRDDWFVNRLDYWGLREARNTSVWPSAVGTERVRADAVAADTVFKLMFRGDGAALDALEAPLREVGAEAFIHRVPHVIEINSSHAVKLPAVAALTKHLGRELSEVIAFGDSLSDLELLENAGVGVLMANASKGLDASARIERTLSNDEDGIGVMLRKHFPTSAPFRS
ncbi:HAD-IIB family hydrolase [Leifsonia sp. TF02-11]|uniref:HAD-IIB family hydrolase n=1 Tax=Leifsonia sp. TF02-11 TaxID=2815212 RepID=UPI001AA15754|nr:HAD-IIB family hydrolase [Leifsonia sp. TF02-11]MBO1737986.1 HAD-IIB family hydrolase [Leifsonia sp. TF02-11]